MRKLVAVLICLAFALPAFPQGEGGHAGMGGASGIGGTSIQLPGFVQYAIASCFSTTCTTGAFSVGALTNGDVLVALTDSVTGVSTSITGCSLTWTANGTQGTQNSTAQFISTAPITSTATCSGGSLPTITSGTSGQLTMIVVELKDVANTVDGTPQYTNHNTNTNFNGAPVTTTVANDMVLSFCFEPATDAYTINSPFTSIEAASIAPGGYYLVSGYNLATATGTVTPAMTYSVGTFHVFVCDSVAIEP